MITYLTGDATKPVGDGNKIIAHVCNDVGAWGAGFVLAVSARWPQPEAAYRGDFVYLGESHFVDVEPDIAVANMVAQTLGGPHPLKYNALRCCLQEVASEAQLWRASVHMPRIGCGLAGGSWDKVEPLIQETLVAAGVEVYVYDLPVSQ